MELQKQPTAKHNNYYPACGCKSEADCVPCPHCGMCIAAVEYCACLPSPFATDENLQYDPHHETMGG